MCCWNLELLKLVVPIIGIVCPLFEFQFLVKLVVA